jgi:LmbE family N-acetylglucosaminyl deacetylase
MKSRIIVFAPHPDDETLGCGGTIARRISEAYEVLIVILTDGRNALLTTFGIESEPTPSELKEIREGEVRRASRILGVTENFLFFLGFEDGTLSQNESQAKERVSNILNRNTPAEVYFTYEKDLNMDHRVTSRVVRDSIEELGLETRGYRYSIEQKQPRVVPSLGNFFNKSRDSVIRVDISRFLPLKKKALGEFKSQIEIISHIQRRPVVDGIERFLKKEEVFFRC